MLKYYDLDLSRAWGWNVLSTWSLRCPQGHDQCPPCGGAQAGALYSAHCPVPHDSPILRPCPPQDGNSYCHCYPFFELGRSTYCHCCPFSELGRPSQPAVGETLLVRMYYVRGVTPRANLVKLIAFLLLIVASSMGTSAYWGLKPGGWIGYTIMIPVRSRPCWGSRWCCRRKECLRCGECRWCRGSRRCQLR